LRGAGVGLTITGLWTDKVTQQLALTIHHPVIDIIDHDGSVVEKSHQRTSHDQVLLSGTMESGAILSYHLRSGPNSYGLPALDWRIQGSTGEIRITSDTFNIFIQTGDMCFEVADYESGVVEELRLKKILSCHCQLLQSILRGFMTHSRRKIWKG
jgi:hypothetical protein